MSKIICTSAIDGAVEWVAKAEAKLAELIKAKGEDFAIFHADMVWNLIAINLFPLIEAISRYQAPLILE